MTSKDKLLERVAAEMGKDPKIVAAIHKARENIKNGKTITHEEVMRGHMRREKLT